MATDDPLSFLRPKASSGVGMLAANVRRIFRVFLTLFVMTFFITELYAAARVVWLCFHIFHLNSGLSTFVTNRMSALFYLSAFTLVVFYWAETFHKNYYETSSFLPRLGVGFLALNVIVYTYQIVMLVLWEVKAHEEREGNPIYELNILLDVLISALLSLGFLCYGVLMFFLTKNTEDGAIEDRNRELVKTVAITTVFAACFLCRVVMFAYRPLTGQHFPVVTFYVLGYYLPELVPSVLQVYLAESTQEKQDKDNKFIDSLYAEGEEAIEEYRTSMRYSHVPINRVRTESNEDAGTHEGSPLLRAV